MPATSPVTTLHWRLIPVQLKVRIPQHWRSLAQVVLSGLQHLSPMLQSQSVSPQQQSRRWSRWPTPSPVLWQLRMLPGGQ